MPCSVQPRNQIFVKSGGFLSLTRNKVKTLIKNLNGKYSQELFDHAKQFATGALKTASKRAIQKTAGATGESPVEMYKIIDDLRLT